MTVRCSTAGDYEQVKVCVATAPRRRQVIARSWRTLTGIQQAIRFSRIELCCVLRRAAGSQRIGCGPWSQFESQGYPPAAVSLLDMRFFNAIGRLVQATRAQRFFSYLKRRIGTCEPAAQPANSVLRNSANGTASPLRNTGSDVLALPQFGSNSKFSVLFRVWALKRHRELVPLRRHHAHSTPTLLTVIRPQSL